jgi:hypothetical protein
MQVQHAQWNAVFRLNGNLFYLPHLSPAAEKRMEGRGDIVLAKRPQKVGEVHQLNVAGHFTEIAWGTEVELVPEIQLRADEKALKRMRARERRQ